MLKGLNLPVSEMATTLKKYFPVTKTPVLKHCQDFNLKIACKDS